MQVFLPNLVSLLKIILSQILSEGLGDQFQFLIFRLNLLCFFLNLLIKYRVDYLFVALQVLPQQLVELNLPILFLLFPFECLHHHISYCLLHLLQFRCRLTDSLHVGYSLSDVEDLSEGGLFLDLHVVYACLDGLNIIIRT